MVGGYKIERTVLKCLFKLVVIDAFADKWRAFVDAVRIGYVLGVEENVLRTGFGGDGQSFFLGRGDFL